MSLHDVDTYQKRTRQPIPRFIKMSNQNDDSLCSRTYTYCHVWSNIATRKVKKNGYYQNSLEIFDSAHILHMHENENCSWTERKADFVLLILYLYDIKSWNGNREKHSCIDS